MAKKKTTTKKKTATTKGKKPKATTPETTPAVDGSQFPDVLTIDQAGAFLQLSRATVYRLINDGAIPVKRIGERYRFSRRALLEWVESDN